MIIQNDAGEDVEVFTADEVTAKAAEAAAAKEAEYAPKLADLTGKLTDAERRAQERAGEFQNVRKLNEEQVAKLTIAERTIYENGLALDQLNKDRIATEETNRKNAVTSVIKAKAGNNTDLETKMTEMWDKITVDATTPEQMEAKAQMVLGAISVSSPDLVATANGFSGSFAPPVQQRKEGDSFADTKEGQGLAGMLGLKTETPK